MARSGRKSGNSETAGETVKVTHLFIDLDGTLLASQQGKLRVSFIRHATAFLKKEYRLGFFSAFKLIHEMRLAAEGGDPAIRNELRVAQVFSRKFSISEEEGLKRAREMVISIFSQLEGHFKPIAGALEFIQWASEHYHLTLATNPVWPKVVVLKRLGWSGIAENYFKVITTAETMHHCKPDVGYYRELLDQSKITHDSVIMIGDSAKKDLPALKVGIPVFLLSPGGFSKRSEGFMTGNFEALRQYLENSR
jgi:FMN phosphatase YigB (HAD superfamily)